MSNKLNLKDRIGKIASGSNLIYYASIDASVAISGAKKHYEIPREKIVDIGPYARGEKEPDDKFKVNGIANIVIADQNGSGCLIIYCDKNWKFLTDTWYESLEEAKKTVEMDYKGIGSKWKIFKPENQNVIEKDDCIFDPDQSQKKKEAARIKSLGELGELFAIKALVDNKYDKIRNLNDDYMNEAFADLSCEKDGIKFIISVKARNMYQLNGKVNNRYNLGTNVENKAKLAEKKHGGIACWMAIQFDTHHYSVFLGSLEELKGSKAIPIDKCSKQEIGMKLVDKKRHYFDFDFYKNK